MTRSLSVLLGALTVGFLSLPLLPRALTAPLGPWVQRLPKGASIARLAVEKGLVRDVDPARSAAPVACPELRAWPVPEEGALEGWNLAICTRSGDVRVCDAWDSSSWDAPVIVVERDGAVEEVLTDLITMEPGAFEVVDVDLDGDGRPETAVVAHAATSNGLPRSFWSLRVLGAAGRVPVADYGEGSFVRSPDHPGCDALATDWMSADDPWRGPGTYYVGQRWRLQDGALRPVGPMRGRRLLRSFKTPYLQAPDGSWRGAPADWLAVAEDWVGPPPGER